MYDKTRFFLSGLKIKINAPEKSIIEWTIPKLCFSWPLTNLQLLMPLAGFLHLQLLRSFCLAALYLARNKNREIILQSGKQQIFYRVEKANNVTGRGGSWCGIHHVHGILLLLVIHHFLIVPNSGSRCLDRVESGRRCKGCRRREAVRVSAAADGALLSLHGRWKEGQESAQNQAGQEQVWAAEVRKRLIHHCLV